MADKPPWEKTWKEMTDAEFWDQLTDRAAWLLYGDLDEHFAPFVHEVLSQQFSAWAFSPRPLDRKDAGWQVAYWLFLSELVRLDFAEYGTSPRGAWLTEDGKRFKRLFDAKYAVDPSFDWQTEDYDTALTTDDGRKFFFRIVGDEIERRPAAAGSRAWVKTRMRVRHIRALMAVIERRAKHNGTTKLSDQRPKHLEGK